LIKQNRSFAVHALALSAQLALLVTAASSPVRAASVAVNGDVTMSASVYTVAESAGTVTITLRRTGGTSGPLSVSYFTVAETALAGKQFTAQTGTVTWANGDAAAKSFSIHILDTTPTTSTKYFAVRMTPATGTIIGSPSNAIVNIVGGTPTITKSIREWVSCNDTIDETAQLDAALLAAANNAFTLIVDCAVLFHSGTSATRSIAVPDGVTLSFQGAGEFLAPATEPPALTIANPSRVTFLDWNLVY
jgi:hypothetical protein